MGTKVQHLKQYSPIPHLLRAMREEAGLSQRDLAQLLGGKTQTYIQYCETKSRRVDLAEFIVWAKACQVTPEEALQRYMALAYPNPAAATKRTSKATYPMQPLPHLLAREGEDAASEPHARQMLAWQAMLTHCMDGLDSASLEQLLALPRDAQKLELARLLLAQLATPKKNPKRKTTRGVKAP